MGRVLCYSGNILSLISLDQLLNFNERTLILMICISIYLAVGQIFNLLLCSVAMMELIVDVVSRLKAASDFQFVFTFRFLFDH